MRPSPFIRLIVLILLLGFAPWHSSRADEPEEAPDLQNFVRGKIADFHKRRIQRISNLKLEKVLARKNPYLLKAKSLETSHELVTELLDSHLAPQEAGIFGSVLEQLAIEVCQKKFGGKKSAAEGIDLEFARDGTRYIVSIKSGPNWGNSSQIKKMRDYFRKAKKTLGTNTSGGAKVVAVNGCCYGTTPTEDRGDYLKLCGKNFWALISGDDRLYLDLIEMIGEESHELNLTFDAEYKKTVTRFADEFSKSYCSEGGAIRWDKITELSSGDRN